MRHTVVCEGIIIETNDTSPEDIYVLFCVITPTYFVSSASALSPGLSGGPPAGIPSRLGTLASTKWSQNLSCAAEKHIRPPAALGTSPHLPCSACLSPSGHLCQDMASVGCIVYLEKGRVNVRQPHVPPHLPTPHVTCMTCVMIT